MFSDDLAIASELDREGREDRLGCAVRPGDILPCGHAAIRAASGSLICGETVCGRCSECSLPLTPCGVCVRCDPTDCQHWDH